MSSNAAVLKDPFYLESDYEKKKDYYSGMAHRELTRDSYNLAFVSFLGIWYLSYGIIAKRSPYGANTMINYGASFLAARLAHEIILKRLNKGISV
jgi:hypothetical protein